MYEDFAYGRSRYQLSILLCHVQTSEFNDVDIFIFRQCDFQKYQSLNLKVFKVIIKICMGDLIFSLNFKASAS